MAVLDQLAAGGLKDEIKPQAWNVTVRIAVVLTLSITLLNFPQRLRAQEPPAASDIIIQHDVPMKTRDGVTLYADIYRPKASNNEKFPVILMRTPYDKNVSWAVSPVFKMVPRGYVVIIQDVRGRYTSQGEWYPFRHEQADGYDTVEWAAALPFSDGKVGIDGVDRMWVQFRCWLPLRSPRT